MKKNIVIPQQLMIDIDDLTPSDENYNQHPEEQILLLSIDLKRYGQQKPVCVQEKAGIKTIIAGEGIWRAFCSLAEKDRNRWGKIWITLLPTSWSRDDVIGFMIADNETRHHAVSDKEQLASLLREQYAKGYDLRSLGQTRGTYKSLLEEIGNPDYLSLTKRKSAGGEEVYVPDNDVPVRSCVGDTWILGDHKLFVGDSTVQSHVYDLLQGHKVSLCLTDPPYSVGYGKLVREPGQLSSNEKGGTYHDPVDVGPFLQKFFSLLPADMLVMTYPIGRHFQELALASRSFDLLYDCVWVKDYFTYVMGRRYQSQHEPILIFRRKGTKGVFHIPNNQATVFSYSRPSPHPDHPTIRPLALWEKLMGYHSDMHDVVYDPFLGSGTTIIAGQRLRRKVFGCEISPQYADVCLRRWEEESGEQAALVNRIEVGQENAYT